MKKIISIIINAKNILSFSNYSEYQNKSDFHYNFHAGFYCLISGCAEGNNIEFMQKLW